MQSVKVNKTDLLAKLRENRESHVNTFEQVLDDYRNEAIRLLEEHIERIRNGDVTKVNVVLPPPKNYEEEYDKAIAMVEWNIDHEIQLVEYEFQQYVLDNWTWKREFNETNALYSKS